jgi:hypothetical protein
MNSAASVCWVGCRTILGWAFCKVVLLSLLAGPLGLSAHAQSVNSFDLTRYMTLSGNFDVGYSKTQFFAPHHDTLVGQWDTRAEFWLPRFRKRLSWGLYLRVGGIGATKPEAWENGWLGMPGAGFQLYPFSPFVSRKSNCTVCRALGPLRLFAEYNRLDYWGKINAWRPTKQTRFGAEYWFARNVNDVNQPWWIELWTGAWWQSANEFAPHYDTGIQAFSLRDGVRVPRMRILSAFTPYLAVENSLTDNKTYYWENKLLAGGGVRFAPALKGFIFGSRRLSRCAIYGEYMQVAHYFRQSTPPPVPNYDVRAGISFNIGEWYR